MAFVDKKETVIQIELTPFGKRKIAKGNFKPDHYVFFDDDIIYDNSYAGTTDALNTAQDRIKGVPRLDTQYLVRGIETSFDLESELISSGSKDLFEELRQSDNTEESERILSFPLGSMATNTQDAPAFTLISWNSKISNSSVTYNDKYSNGFKTAQIQMNLTHSVSRDHTSARPLAVEGEVYDSETFQLDFTEPEVEFLDGSKIVQKSEPLLISLEESNVKYSSENFEVEIFEIVATEPTVQDPERTSILVKLTEADEVLKYFNITTDDSIEEIPTRNKVNKNFFSN